MKETGIKLTFVGHLKCARHCVGCLTCLFYLILRRNKQRKLYHYHLLSLDEKRESKMLSKLSKITASEFLENVNPNLFTPNPELFLLSKIFSSWRREWCNNNLSTQNWPWLLEEDLREGTPIIEKGGRGLADRACVKCLIMEI